MTVAPAFKPGTQRPKEIRFLFCCRRVPLGTTETPRCGRSLRGNGGVKLFEGPEEYAKFEEILAEGLQRYPVELFTYSR